MNNKATTTTIQFPQCAELDSIIASTALATSVLICRISLEHCISQIGSIFLARKPISRSCDAVCMP